VIKVKEHSLREGPVLASFGCAGDCQELPFRRAGFAFGQIKKPPSDLPKFFLPLFIHLIVYGHPPFVEYVGFDMQWFGGVVSI
jgi:hypothetical protein